MDLLSAPKLTIVLCGRNDKYGGDFLQRLSNSLRWNHELAIRQKGNVELIFIEYSPLKDEASLSELDIWPNSDYWKTKVIPYHPESNADQFEEFKAKNIGISQATGDYILVTNADIFLPEWCLSNYSSLPKNQFFLADRLNILTTSADWNEMVGLSDEYCMKGGIFKRPKFIPHKIYYRILPVYLNLRRRMYKAFPFLLKPGVQFLLEHHFTACGDFMLAHRSVWQKVGGFRIETSETAHVDSLFLLKVISNGINIQEIPMPVLHQNHEHRYSFRKPTKEMQKMLELLLTEIVKFQKLHQPITDSVLQSKILPSNKMEN